MIDIYPAIDLKEGKAVRLFKGEMSSAKIYGEALDFAKKFQDFGASWVHIVDLDGAFAGSVKNKNIIEEICTKTNLKVQIGGGIRNEQTIKNYLDSGAARLILGSMALKDPNWSKQMACIYPIAIGIDSVNEKVAIEGWGEVASKSAYDLALEFKDSKASALICTDISRDGALSGINAKFSAKMAKISQIYTIASGGFKDLDDIKKVKDEFILNEVKGGVIIGKAFYENMIDLKEAFKLV